MIVTFYCDYYNLLKSNDDILTKEECCALFVQIMKYPENFFGLEVDTKIIQFCILNNKLLVEIVNPPNFINYQMYASKEECIEIIKQVYNDYQIKIYPQMKLVDTFNETLDDIVK